MDKMVKDLLNYGGKGSSMKSQNNAGDRIMYPAIVTGVKDPTDQNRIKARVVEIENGAIKGIASGADGDYSNATGKDGFVKKDTLLPWAYPMVPEFLHVRPKEGEMVWIIISNPSRNNSGRFWVGPIITSKFKLKRQQYSESVKILDYSLYNPNKISDENNTDSSIAFPQEDEIALQGRDDADLILKNRELLLIAGKFNKTTDTNYTLNVESPSFLNLAQKVPKNKGTALETGEELLEKFSEARLQSTNVNIYSPRGKYRNPGELEKYETNKDLKSFDELANTLHPAVFGDELIKVLDMIIRLILEHIHTPQKPLASTGLSNDLGKYSVKGDLQKLISNHIRIN